MVLRKKSVGQTENDLERGFVKPWLNSVEISLPICLTHEVSKILESCQSKKKTIKNKNGRMAEKHLF